MTPRRRGFTLLELLVALTIAGAALAVLFRGVSENLSALTIAGQYENAISRCRSHLAALAQSTALAPGENTGDDGGGYRWHLRIDPVATALLPNPVLDPSAAAPRPASVSLYHIQVDISWLQDSKERHVSLDTMRIDQQDQP